MGPAPGRRARDPGGVEVAPAADDADLQTLAWPLTHHTWLEVLRKPLPSAASTAQSPGPGGARILVAEDSRPLQMIAEAQLRRLGHRVGLAAKPPRTIWWRCDAQLEVERRADRVSS